METDLLGICQGNCSLSDKHIRLPKNKAVPRNLINIAHNVSLNEKKLRFASMGIGCVKGLNHIPRKIPKKIPRKIIC